VQFNSARVQDELNQFTKGGIAGEEFLEDNMETLLGFHVGFWDYVTFIAIFIVVVTFLVAGVFILGLPGRIAIARNHPEADAVNLMGWIGFLAIVPWIQALIWAFKPTNVIDIRYLPEEERRETDAMIARLRGAAPSPAPPLDRSPTS
jgi:hypothetical protein